MLTLSKPISAGQAQAYHKSEFANAKENYYTEGERVRGEWQGQLAARYGLTGEVNEEQFARLSEGQHPQTGAAPGAYSTCAAPLTGSYTPPHVAPLPPGRNRHPAGGNCPQNPEPDQIAPSVEILSSPSAPDESNNA
ncbi:MAG TPA: relaxase domain-containing protein [Acidobacteriaceae bacterium]|jgi:hypothetical protein